MSQAQMYADQAVFQLQLSSNDAVKYIAKNAGINFRSAEQVFKSTLTFHRQK
jgi:hypothetical protein